MTDESAAAPGDVVAYQAEPGNHEDTGMINHSAVIAKVGPDGISVDSELGALTTARHEIADSPLGSAHTRYTPPAVRTAGSSSLPPTRNARTQWPYSPDEAADGAR